jgi:Bacterial lipid A biosynthesis acyltransferase
VCCSRRVKSGYEGRQISLQRFRRCLPPSPSLLPTARRGTRLNAAVSSSWRLRRARRWSPCRAGASTDGAHGLRFEEALGPIECDAADEAIVRNTRAYSAFIEQAILRHPEQWFWFHRRWKQER